MKLNKISRSKSFEMVNTYGLKAWDKFGLEADLGENENPIEAYKELEAMIEAAFKQSYPNNPNQEIIKQVKEPEAKLSKEEKQKKCITDTTTIDGSDGLSSFAFLVSNNPHLQETYDNHLKKLTDGL